MTCDNCDNKMRVTTVKDYHYIMSGLDNVYLSGMPMYKCRCGETKIELPQIEELHIYITGKLLRKPALLTGKEIKFIRKQMKLKAANLAKQLDVNSVTLSRWENNEKPIGKANDKLLRLMCLHYFINSFIKKGLISTRSMQKFIAFAEDITTMIYKLRSRKSRIHILEPELQKRKEEELLLAPV